MSTFVRGGGGAGEKVKIDGVKVANKMELTSYKGANPLTIGQAGVAFPANTLFLEDFDILNGVNGEDLTDTAADQKTAVEDLLKMVNRKIAMNNGEGQYVWKKSIGGITYTAYCTKANGASGGAFTLNSSDVDLTQLNDLTVLAPIEISRTTGGYTPAIKSVDGINFEYWLNGAYQNALTASWNKSTKTLTLTGTVMSGSNWTPFFYDTHSEKEFIDYAVSSDAEAYPNKAVHTDGYWYELIEDGLDLLSVTGCTKMAVDKITYSSRTAGGGKVSHSLGEVPKVALLFNTSRTIVNYDVTASIIVKASSGSKCYGVSIYGYASDGSALNSTALQNDTSAMSATAVKAIMNSSIYYTAGVEYTLITMA